MKIVSASIVILLLFAAFPGCKKSKPVNNATCTTCSNTLLYHSDTIAGLFYCLPTAFTPNGDLRNDVLYLLQKGLDTSNSTITIWDIGGTEVFTGRITQRWYGKDLKGNLCAAGQYPVYLQLKTTTGATIDTCACVHILTYTGSCIKTNGVTYYFPDQFNVLTGAMFPSQETLCP